MDVQIKRSFRRFNGFSSTSVTNPQKPDSQQERERSNISFFSPGPDILIMSFQDPAGEWLDSFGMQVGSSSIVPREGRNATQCTFQHRPSTDQAKTPLCLCFLLRGFQLKPCCYILSEKKSFLILWVVKRNSDSPTLHIPLLFKEVFHHYYLKTTGG